MGQFGTGEIILIALVILLLFGAKRLPDTARALGKSLRIFKAETQALREDDTRREPAEAARPSVETTRLDTDQPVPRALQAAPQERIETRPADQPGRVER